MIVLYSCKGCSDDRYGRCLIASGPTPETAETTEEQEAREWYETHDEMI